MKATTVRSAKFLTFLFILAISGIHCKGTKGTAGPKDQPDPPKSTGVFFEESDMLQPVMARAKAEGKLIFLDFYTTWCLPCKMMQDEVFPDKTLGKFMNSNFLNMHLDAEKGNGSLLSLVFEVGAYPTLIFIDPEGKVLEKQVGALGQSELQALGESALRIYRGTGTE